MPGLSCISSLFHNKINKFNKTGARPFQGGASFVDRLCYFCLDFVVFACACLFIQALWSPYGEELTSWLSFVMTNCEVVTFQLVS